jgi:hypothetical protein
MNSIDWKSAVEIVGIGALIVGLYFVYEELRQTSTIARANMSLEVTRITIDLNAQERDPAFAEVLVRARTVPDELTAAERIQLNAYYRDVIEVYIREIYSFNLGIFPEWTSKIRRTAPAYFGSGYGRVYWNVLKTQPDVPSVFIEEVDRSLENRDAVEFWKEFDQRILRELASE